MENYLINNRLEEKFIDDLAINQRSQGNSKNNKKASKCCSCCCCCFSDKVEIHSLKYIKNWRMYLEKESILHTNDPFKILTSLWLDNSVTKELENIRLNPNLISTIRDDLEFYITQLCTYLIFGDSDSFDELVAFLCKASCACFYFAHRIIWFFMSLDEKEIDQGYNKKINGILNIIFNMFRSINSKDKLVNMYIANSYKYLKILESKDLLFLYRSKISKSSLTAFQLEYLQRITEAEEKINEFDEIYDLIIQNNFFPNKIILEKIFDNEKISNVPQSDNEKEIFYRIMKINKEDIFIKNFYKSGEQFEILDSNIDYENLNNANQNYNKNIELNYKQQGLFDDASKNNLTKINYEIKEIKEESINEGVEEEIFAKNVNKNNISNRENEYKMIADNDETFNRQNSSKLEEGNKVRESKKTVIEKEENSLRKSIANFNQNTSLNDVNFDSFNSTLNFFELLGSIGDRMNQIKNDDECLNYLKKNLFNINKGLPANIYLPFIKIRNYCIAHIAVSETKIFKTKNRCPYMILVECFRPEELSLEFELEQLNSFDKKKPKKKLKSGSVGQKVNRLVETSNLLKKGSFEKKMSFVKTEENIDDENFISSLNLLSEENDILNSKPIKVKMYGKIVRNIATENKIIVEVEDDYSVSKKIKTDIRSNNYNKIKTNISRNDNVSREFSLNNPQTEDYKYLSYEDYGISPQQDQLDMILKEKSSIYLNSDSITLSRKPTTKLKKDNKKSTNDNSNEHEKVKQNKRSPCSTVIEEDINNSNNEILNMPSFLNDSLTNKNQISAVYDKEFKIKPNIKKLEISKKEINYFDKLNKIERSNIISNLSNIFDESLIETHNKLKKISPYGNLKSFKIFKVLVKSGDDLRQEQFATQLINEFNQIFYLEKIDVYLNTYEVISTGHNTGIVQFINESISIDKLKSKTGLSLKNFFDCYYSKQSNLSNISLNQAKLNFIKSSAGYCLVCYFLQIKDRHNANILLDRNGFLSHIDFGYMLTNFPGSGLEFEKAPFKFTNEILELMGGTEGENFEEFRKLLRKGFIACVKHSSKIIMLIEMMYCGNGFSMSCFKKGKYFI